MSFIKSCEKNIFFERFIGEGNTEVIYVPGHKVIPYQKFKSLKIKEWCVKNGIPFTWFDYMGYGKSEGDKAVWQLTEWLQNLTDIVISSPYKKQILIGESMGGYLMFAEALLQPDKIKGLFGFAPGFGKSFRSLSDVFFISDVAGKIKIDIKNTDGYNYIDQPLDIKCPVQLVFSYDDESVNIKSSDYIRQSIKMSSIMKVRGINHSMENDELINICCNYVKLLLERD